MNAWAERHRRLLDEALEGQLEAGEELLAADRVAVGRLDVAGSTQSIRGRIAGPRSQVPRVRAHGFPVPAPIFGLAVTDRRLLFLRTTALLARPAAFYSSLPLSEVATVRALRWPIGRRLALVRGDLAVLMLKPVGRLAAAEVAAALEAAKG